MARLALLLALVCAPLPGAAQPASDAAPERVTLQLKWQHQFQFAGYYAAVERGYYRDAGLEVDLVPAQPGEEPMQAVIDGRAEFGVGTTDLLLMRDAGLPVVVLAAIFQHSPLTLMIRKDSGFANIHDLATGRLMIEPHSAELFAFLTEEGIALDRVNFVEHNFDTADLLDGSVDAMSVYSTDEPYDLQSRGIDYILFRPIESGIDFYGDNLFAMRGQIEAHPERTRRFVEASMRGWRYAMANPREIAELIVTRYSDRKSVDHLLFEAEAMRPLVNAEIVEPGYVNPVRWRRIAERYASLGMIAPGLDLDGFVYAPDLAPDFSHLYRLFAVLAGIALLLAALVFWYVHMNRRLRHEVAERTAAQVELERLNAQKGMLISIIGHDLRAAFTVLLPYGEELVEDGEKMDRSRLARLHTAVRDATRSAYALLSNLVEWEALQAGLRDGALATVPAGSLIADVARALAPLAAAKEITVRTDAPADATIHADPRMIETILRNLIGNAVKFTSPGGSITVTARRNEARTEVAVTDTGIGIAPERLERLFEVEPKRTSTGTAGEHGSGLGLVLCRDFAAANDGTLRVESEAGRGTTITLSLPAEEAEAAATAEADAAPAPA